MAIDPDMRMLTGGRVLSQRINPSGEKGGMDLNPIMRMRSPWFVSQAPNPKAKLRLFCFPYAGGAASIYHQWHTHLSNIAEVYAVQLPGRGSRLSETPFTDVSRLVDELLMAITPYLDKPFAFFGHSLGALISFELAHQLELRHGIRPVVMFMSGKTAPHLPRNYEITYDLPDREFIDELIKLNGTPVEVLDHPELIELILPSLRADFQMVEAYQYKHRPPLRCPLMVLGGEADPHVSRLDMEAWKEHAQGELSLRLYAGDHFFLRSAEPEILQLIWETLEKASARI